ncbi:hypothetical protein B0A50_04972 [Salinomyces thailandicus]|uniref:Uncharacterized protein n=1 Tax=Salinomyces thailandicus TaxID=706561 RepID=A0A4U0TXZ8_9PEZI|nr:hypothetical protein B0A50_04972 [Salinomyces thailandica]
MSAVKVVLAQLTLSGLFKAIASLSGLLGALLVNLTAAYSGGQPITKLRDVMECNGSKSSTTVIHVKKLVNGGIQAADSLSVTGPSFEHDARAICVALLQAPSLLFFFLDTHVTPNLTRMEALSKPAAAHATHSIAAANLTAELAVSLGGTWRHLFATVGFGHLDAICNKWMGTGRAWSWRRGSKRGVRKDVCDKVEAPLCCELVHIRERDLRYLAFEVEELRVAVERARDRFVVAERSVAAMEEYGADNAAFVAK